MKQTHSHPLIRQQAGKHKADSQPMRVIKSEPEPQPILPPAPVAVLPSKPSTGIKPKSKNTKFPPMRRPQGTISVVVLGMHGGGTSLVASMLDALGVNMSANPRAKVKWYKNYEDSDFVHLNESILKLSHGSWRSLPKGDVGALMADEALTQRIKRLIDSRSHGLWGFKDPRTALTVQLYHPHLVNPHYIVVRRKLNDCARSIQSRGNPPGSYNGWVRLARAYYAGIDAFLETIEAPVLEMNFERLLNHKQSKAEVLKLIQFLGLDVRLVKKALSRINYARR